MADEELQARLQSHSKAFEGLMSLIPAKVYYGEDNEDQWKRKKQTKEEKRAAKKAKLDPASNKSALDIQNERKRKREQDAEDDEDTFAGDLEQPRQGLKGTKNAVKKPKLSDHTETKVPTPGKKFVAEKDQEALKQARVEKRREKRERKNARKEKVREERAAKTNGAPKTEKTETVASTRENSQTSKGKSKPKSSEDKPSKKSSTTPSTAKPSEEKAQEAVEDEEDSQADFDGPEDEEEEEDKDGVEDDAFDEDVGEDVGDDSDGDLGDVAFPGLAADDLMATDELLAFDSSVSDDESLTFDNAQESSASSASSILPDASAPGKQLTLDTVLSHEPTERPAAESQTREKLHKIPQIDPEVLQERLQARLNALRAARKADGPNGKPARNRQELIEARRKKEENRKAHKKELRQKTKLAQDAEAEAARLRGGSGSPMWSPGTFSPREQENNFSFGRVAFDDGAEMDASLSTLRDPKKKKGPQDIKTALEAAQNKRARLSGLDETKRADIEEKDRWLNAKKRINGEKLRDDTNLLKKTLKRKEKGKAKSEKEWGERIEGVKAGKEARQKKREDNLRKRKEEKGMKGKKKSGAAGKAKAKGGVKKRPGFEGSFRAGGRSKA